MHGILLIALAIQASESAPQLVDTDNVEFSCEERKEEINRGFFMVVARRIDTKELLGFMGVGLGGQKCVPPLREFRKLKSEAAGKQLSIDAQLKHVRVLEKTVPDSVDETNPVKN